MKACAIVRAALATPLAPLVGGKIRLSVESPATPRPFVLLSQSSEERAPGNVGGLVVAFVACEVFADSAAGADAIVEAIRGRFETPWKGTAADCRVSGIFLSDRQTGYLPPSGDGSGEGEHVARVDVKVCYHE